MMGYKIFCSDWRCRDTQYAVGETIRVDGEVVVCKNGLHFCERALDCVNYYDISPIHKYAEVRADGVVVTLGDKSATNALYIVRELSYREFLDLCTYKVETWHPNGVQQSSREYIGNYLNGTTKEWYDNGNIAMIANYVHDMVIGSAHWWYRNGNKGKETHYMLGHRDGVETRWDEQGFKKLETRYEMNIVRSRKYFDDTGEVDRETVGPINHAHARV